MSNLNIKFTGNASELKKYSYVMKRKSVVHVMNRMRMRMRMIDELDQGKAE
jgi:hypothetical protein